MPSAPVPTNEPGRLAELDRYAIVSTPPEAVFDRITKLASHFFHCPVALISFVEGQRQWFKSCIGVDFGEGPRSESFCAWALLGNDVMVVPDARADPRFVDNALVTGVVGIRFYAGAPLITPRGYNLGTLCIIDREPRPQGLTRQETEALADLAALAMSALEARLVAQESRETHDLLQTTLASIGDGVIVTDAKAQITFINPAAEQITGWKNDDAATLAVEKVFSVINEVTRERVESPIPAALKEGRIVGLSKHAILVTKDGSEVAVDDSASPILRGEKVIGGVLIFRDVTKRREAERALEYSENQYRTTFANAPLGLVLTHTDGLFIESNAAYRKLTGYSEKELLAINFISLTHPSEIEDNRRQFQRLISGEIESYCLEKRITNRDGALRWVRAHAALLRDAHGGGTKVIGLVEDITESKRAEERFRFLAESIPEMVWTAKPDGMLDYVNGQGSRYFGVPQASLLGAGWLERVHLEDQPKAVQRWMDALETGNAYEAEFRLKRGSDASWRLHLARALPLLADGVRITQWFGTCTDIEDRHQTARQIEDDRRRWRELLLQTPAAIAVLRGPEHELEWVNAGFERLVGRSAEMLTGKPAMEALPETATQGYGELLDNVYRTGDPFHGHESFARLGPNAEALRDVYINFACLPTRNTAGEIDGIFAHLTDVTDMVAARKAIEESESQFRTLAETIPHLTWMADETGHIFWYNRRWFDYTGTTLEEMQGWGWEKVHDPNVLPDVLKNWVAAISSGTPFEMVFPLKGADGQFRTFLTRVEPITDSGGKVVRWFGTNTDITDQRKTEDQLRRINHHLEEFSYVASHDLQEPLRMVSIYTQLMLKSKDGSKKDLETFAGFVSDGVKRMDTLIKDLLTFSRSVHADEAEAGPADLGAAFDEALSVLKSRIEESGAVIKTSALPMTRGDTAQLAHVFQNILGNALKYSKPAVQPEIHVAAKRNGHTWVISIRDNGIGFEPQYAERIFGLFKRLHKNEYPGTGLGLAICKRIVERYGGQMWAESVPGEGSTFHFSLPEAISSSSQQ